MSFLKKFFKALSEAFEVVFNPYSERSRKILSEIEEDSKETI